MRFTRRTAVLFCLLPLAIFVFGQTKTAVKEDSKCKSQQTCTECIRTHQCIWCSERREISDQDDTSLKPRCVGRAWARTQSSWCPEKAIVYGNSIFKIELDREFSSDENQQVQIRPQRVKMSLRSGESKTFKIKYQQAKDYPVDLYFLMDLSNSMINHKKNLSNLGQKLTDAIRNLTKNFQLGFGSFIDKVLLPMTSLQMEWSELCSQKTNVTCSVPYAYRNHLRLTPGHLEFQKMVKKAAISWNIDNPEGGLDAMMQAMVCWEAVGWRENARHILVYSSDADYHIAGDGRLAGIVEPNDETCHLNATGFYTHAEILDYPSISQINKKAQENNMNIIFAVVPEYTSNYKALSTRIDGASVGVLDGESDSVVNLIRSHYEKLTNTITMTHQSSKQLEVTYRTRCSDPFQSNRPLAERNECSGVRVNTLLEFEVTIKAVDCPESRNDWRQTVRIKPQGINEEVVVDVELICDCPCSVPGNEGYVSNSSMCTRNGDLICGVCVCGANSYGRTCDCNDNLGGQRVMSDEPCRGEDQTICSGRGACICGVCKCDTRPNPDEKFSGDFCQCDNFSCSQFGGQVCGGPNRGRCECGMCKCNPGLAGEACDCRSSKATCYPPGENSKICNGFGECVCGSCQCTEGRSGEFCQECPTCPSQRCDELKNCVECLAHKSGPEYAAGEICPNCATIDLELVDRIDDDPKATHVTGTHVCTVLDTSGCSFVFSYLTPTEERGDTRSPEVKAEKMKKCSKPAVSALGVAGGAIGLTLFLGLLSLVIWKVVTMVHDHREWVKFENERVCANWERGENPLFKEPTTSFKNPTFDGAQQSQT